MKKLLIPILLLVTCLKLAAATFPNSFTTAPTEAAVRSNAVFVIRAGMGFNSGFVTNNGFIIYATNGVPNNAIGPNGSIAYGTGQIYTKTNGVWVALGTGVGSGDVVAAGVNNFTGNSNNFTGPVYATSVTLSGTLNANEIDTPTLVATNISGDGHSISNLILRLKAVSLTDAATVTPNADTTGIGILTSLSQSTTIANPTGTPSDGQELILRIKSSSVRALTWGSQFRSGSNITLPSATTGSSLTDYLKFIYNVADTKWDIVGRPSGY